MNEEEQEKLYELLFKDTKNKLEETIKKQQKEIEELKSEFAINTEIHKRDLKIKELKEINECLHQTDKELFVSKDKIREHLKRFEEIEKEFIFIDNKSTAREINKALIEFSKRLLEE